MMPFSQEERRQVLDIERRFRACRDELLLGASAAEDACGERPQLVAKNKKNESILVSALLTFHNHVELTSVVLVSLVTALSQVRTRREVLLVDDSSTEDAGVLRQLMSSLASCRWCPEIRMARTTARSYGRAANFGAARLTGDYVLLLNNDVLLFPSTVATLVSTFSTIPRTGAAAPRLLDEDGRLQEAGSIILRDGSAFHLNPARLGTDESLVRHARRVDYASAACLVVRRCAFLDGFDDAFAPAYYEDTDLAMRLRAHHDLDVVYQPFAVAVHSGSLTYSNYSEKEFLLEKNRRAFARKWRHELESHYYGKDVADFISASPGTMFLPATRLSGSLKVLYADWEVPCLERDSGSVRAINLLRIMLSRGLHVTFAATDLDPTSPCVAALNRLGVHVVRHREVVLASLSYACDFDFALVSRRETMTSWARALRVICPRMPVVFDTVDLHFLRELRWLALKHANTYAPTLNDLLAAIPELENKRKNQSSSAAAEAFGRWEVDMRAEMELMREAAAIVAVSPVEIEAIRSFAARLGATTGPLFLLSNVHDERRRIDKTLPYDMRRGVVFVGNFAHEPNLDALRYMIDEILPLVEDDDIALHVVGSGRRPAWVDEELAFYNNNNKNNKKQRRIVVHGFVRDLGSFLSQMRVAVAPLRVGAGVKGKINTAMLHGVPVVATSVATEGMYLSHGENVMVADLPETFAAHISRVYSNATLWTSLSQKGLAQVTDRFSTRRAAAVLDELLAHLKASHHHLEDRNDNDDKYGLGAVIPAWRRAPPDAQFERVSSVANRVFDTTGRALNRAWRVGSEEAARAQCSADELCGAYCYHPFDWTFFYYGALARLDLRDRGAPGEYPPGWTCASRADSRPETPRFTRVYAPAHFTFEARREVDKATGVRDVKTARDRCVRLRRCNAFCHDSKATTYWFADVPSKRAPLAARSSSSSSGSSGGGGGGYTCWVRALPPISMIDYVADGHAEDHLFDEVYAPRNFVFGASKHDLAPLHTLWKISDAHARAICIVSKCMGYCNNPSDYSWLYEIRPDPTRMHPRNRRGRFPPGWTCYIRRIHKIDCEDGHHKAHHHLCA
ncbi:hypothetical protein CTAYLR_004086 [Chrysophaeum taylorii]|uniref:Glycosyltransferase 2-like domain-containing protein n=1 Tax=Chrysophaeum taylorii TaxID=2483200 RepID=A0AAD7XKC4_9STRA|nr:hypothetical protein CTAYLR_004086 [Chrysophaeum taylorii]